jgi:peptidyl-prolyl cis-trans isomerase-like protein 2
MALTMQSFITYRKTPHLDQIHTVFGKLVGGQEVLDELEKQPVADGSRPIEEIVMTDIVILVDPFEEFMKQRIESELEEERKAYAKLHPAEDDIRTWTGKSVNGNASRRDDEDNSIGKYVMPDTATEGTIEVLPEPPKKKVKKGFGDFSGW